jgi:hypothetical protein
METSISEITDSKQLPKEVFNLFFNKHAISYKGKPLKFRFVLLRNGKGRVKKLEVGDFTYLEQNPYSSSRWASLARDGKKIMWIIHTPTKNYIGRVVDGQVTKL